MRHLEVCKSEIAPRRSSMNSSILSVVSVRVIVKASQWRQFNMSLTKKKGTFSALAWKVEFYLSTFYLLNYTHSQVIFFIS